MQRDCPFLERLRVVAVEPLADPDECPAETPSELDRPGPGERYEWLRSSQAAQGVLLEPGDIEHRFEVHHC